MTASASPRSFLPVFALLPVFAAGVVRLALCAGLLLLASTGLADERADEGASGQAGSVRSGGEPAVAESLESMGSLPWYDAESGEVAPVHVEPRVDDSVNRNSRWLPKPQQSTPNPTQPASQGTSSVPPPPPSGTFSIAEILGWVLVVGLMLLVVGLLVYAFLKIEGTESASASDVAAPEEREQDFQTRLEKLPVEVRRPSGDLLEEADRLAAAGQLDEAIIYLFGHRLLQLDRHHVIRLARGKTNRQYLTELFGRNELRAIMRETVSVFEASYFGRYEVTAERFAEIRGSQTTLESLLAQLREAA